MKFPYVKLPAKPDAAFPNRQSFARPMCAVGLEKDGKHIVIYALVDSGADICLFPASLAGQLGITIPNQNTYIFSGTSAQPQIAYFETVKATLWNGDPNFEVVINRSSLFFEIN